MYVKSIGTSFIAKLGILDQSIDTTGIKNEGIIMCLFPVTVAQVDKCYLLNVNKEIYNESFILGCFLLGVLVICILLMSNNSLSSNISITGNPVNVSGNRDNELAIKLLAQLSHNSLNSTRPLTYSSFPTDHVGYLNLDQRIRFVSIIRTSYFADQYRFGSSVGNMYVKNSNRHPIVTIDMVVEVMARNQGF